MKRFSRRGAFLGVLVGFFSLALTGARSPAPLRGASLDPPIISVTPPNLTESLFTGGNSTQTLTISNSGQSDLVWQGRALPVGAAAAKPYTLTAPRLGVIDPETGKVFPAEGLRAASVSALLIPLTDVHILWDRKHGESPMSGWSVILTDLTNRGATVIENTGTITAALLESYDVLWLTDVMSSFSIAEIQAVQSWIRAGGSLFIECDQSTIPLNSLLLGLGTGISFNSSAAAAGTTTKIHPHETTQAVGSIYLAGPQDHLEVSAPASRLVDDAADVPVCAVCKVDEGVVFAASDELFADGPVGNADNQLFGNRVIDWITRDVAWLGMAPREGTVPPGGSQEVTVTFDATGLQGGDYDADLVISSNDPVTPEVSVAAHLQVTSGPAIVLSESSVDFGPVFVGGSMPHTIRISNEGVDPLVVSEISSSHAAFTVNLASFSLDPGGSQDIIATFAPTSTGLSLATLTIASNDPDNATVTVELRGEGLEPPIISIAPETLTESLLTGGMSAQIFTITNSGQNDLVWQGGAVHIGEIGAKTYALTAPRPGVIDPETENTYPASGPRTDPISATLLPLTDVRVLWDRAHGGSPLSGWSVMMSDLTNRGATVIENTQPLTPANLEGFDVLWLADVLSSFSTSEITAVQTWIRAGGALLIECDESSLRLNPLLSGLGIGISFNSSPASAGTTTRVYPHEMTAGVGSVYLPGPQDRLVVSSPAHRLVDDPAGVPVCAFGVVEKGAVFAVADETFADGPVGYANNQLFGNQVIDWLTRRVDWLSLTPVEGTVPAGSSQDVKVTFDAANLDGGDYDANLLVSNNDPLNPNAIVATQLHVTAAPDIAVSGSLLDFGQLYIGLSREMTITFFNKGASTLVVSGISSGNADYTADATDFSLEPLESRNVIVTFAPTVAGPILGTLSVASNDPDEATVEVELRGEGVEPPVISVSPDSFADSLYTGETATHLLTISNSGGTNLEFDITTEKVDLLGASVEVRTQISVPRSSGEFPRGMYEPAVGAAPENGRAAGSASTNALVPLGINGSAFSTEWGYGQATRFSLGTPEVLNFVGAVPTFIPAGDFSVGDNSFAYALNDMNEFMRIDTLNGAQTILGTLVPYGGEEWTGMALDPTDGRMYATSTNIGSSSLYIIDVEGPAVTRIGSIGFPGIIALAVDKNGNMYAEDMVTDELVAVNKTTGAGTAIGSLGFDANYAQGMAFDPVREELYLAAFNNYTYQGELRIADRTTGATALVGVLGATSPGGLIDLGWLGIPGLGGVWWLVVGPPNSGIVPPGTSMDVTVTFDAAGQSGGDYDANIVISNNDPLRSEILIPAHLQVRGAPDIMVSETLLDYGPLFIGAALSRKITISNQGTEQLVVSGVSSSHADYTVDVSSFSLAPETSQDVTVTFAPTSVGLVSGTLSIVSNDPDESTVEVELRGEGLEPPVVSVAPESLTASLLTWEISEQTFTITNSGGNDLTWEAGLIRAQGLGAPPGMQFTLAAPVAPATFPEKGANDIAVIVRTTPISAALGNLTGVRILWNLRNGGAPISGWSVIMSDLTGRGGTVVENSQPITPALLDGYDVLWITDFSTSFTSAERTAIQAWVRAGGSLVLECDETSSGVNNLLSGLGSGITYVEDPAAAGTTTNIHEHAMTVGVGGVYLQAPQDHLAVTSPAQRLVDDSAGVPACAYAEVDEGNVFAVCDEIFANGPVAGADNQLFGNQVIDWITWRPRWLNVAPMAGTVPPGVFEDVSVTFDAAGLYSGDYKTDILVINNDPANPAVVIPTRLHVTGLPDIALSEVSIDYGVVMIGASSAHTITITNSGTSRLEVSDISSSHTDYTLNVTSLSLDPQESGNVTVTFAPSSTGPILATVTITSNDPDEGTVVVALSGEGLEPPIISVAPDSLHEDLDTGEIATRTITVTNTGGSDLIWNASAVVPQGVGAVPGKEYTLALPVAPATYPESGATASTSLSRTTPVTAYLRNLTGVHILWNRRHGGSPVSGWSVMVSDLTSRGATVVESSQPITSALLDGYHVLWLTDPLHAFDGSETAAVQAWVRAGGSLIIECDESSSPLMSLISGLGTGITVRDFPTAVAGTTTAIHPHGMTAGVDSVYLPGPQDRLEIALPAVKLVDDTVGTPVCAYARVEEGLVFVVVDETFANGPIARADNQLFGNQVIDWFATSAAWLTVSPITGTVPPGSSEFITTTFDATGLYGGEYDADVLITNNSLVEPAVVVPTYMRVTGAPDIAASPESLDFGSPFIGVAVSRVVTVENVGTDTLKVTRVRSTNPDVSVNPAPFELPVYGTRNLSLTLVATVAGAFVDSLIVSSNDPDEGEFAIPMIGDPRLPPGIAVTPAALNAALLSGERATQSLKIKNPDASPLQFQCYVQYTSAASSMDTVAPSHGSIGEGGAIAAPIPGPMGEGRAIAAPVPGPTGEGRPTAVTSIASNGEADATVRWLSVLPNAGTVAPADSATLDVTFNATGLVDGSYSAELRIGTNIPSTPLVIVPVTMDVTGFPAITVSDSILDFGDVFAGFEKTMPLAVSNYGFNNLYVTDVSVDDPMFSVAPTNFVLPRLAQQTLDVTVLSPRSGSISKTLTITSNDPQHPSLQIDLTAEVIIPPVLSVSKGGISSVVGPGESHLDSLIVSNTGGSPLFWSAEVLHPGSALASGHEPETLPSTSTLRVLWHGDHGWGGISYWSTIVTHLTSQGATVTESNAPIDAALLGDYDVIWLGERSAALSAEERSALVAWTTGGGNVLIEADAAPSAVVYGELLDDLGSSIIYLSVPGRTGLTPYINPHQTTFGVGEVYLVSAGSLLSALTPLVVDSFGGYRIVIACDVIGQGKLVVMADHTFHDLAIHSGDNLLFASQVFEWFGLPRWLTLSASGGSLNPGETALIEATSDATNLAPGEHRLDIVVRGNDPATPSVTVPVILVVTSGDVTGIDPEVGPARFELYTNHPNPFNPTTTIAYDLPRPTTVRLVIYDVSGRKIRDLVDANEPAGHRTVIWDARNASNEPVASGVYFYRLIAGDFVRTRKMVLLK